MDNALLITYNKQLLYNNAKVTMSILDYWAHTKSPPRPAQIETLSWIEANQDKKYLFCDLPVGCHAPGTQILMYDGTIKRVEHIQVNDVLMGPDSTPRVVHTLYSGVDEMFKITPTKGDPFIVNQHHILSLDLTPSSINYINLNILHLKKHNIYLLSLTC
jgi:hypothetical protein